MPEQYFPIALTDTDRIRVEIHTEHGEVTSFVVQYEIFLNGRWMAVTRYDTAHDVAHRDTIDEQGRVIRKQWYTAMAYGAALTFGIEDLKVNWQRYREEFLRRVR